MRPRNIRVSGEKLSCGAVALVDGLGRRSLHGGGPEAVVRAAEVEEGLAFI
jgi:hypothetical protein